MWPLGAKVWVRWGSFGWRPGIVRGYRDTRVGVRVVDGLWPFDGSRLSRRPDRMTWKAPSSLRPRKSAVQPQENANSAPGCVVLISQMQPRRLSHPSEGGHDA